MFLFGILTPAHLEKLVLGPQAVYSDWLWLLASSAIARMRDVRKLLKFFLDSIIFYLFLKGIHHNILPTTIASAPSLSASFMPSFLLSSLITPSICAWGRATTGA